MRALSSKASILQHISDARMAHKDWVTKAEKLVNGLDGFRGQKVEYKVDKTFIPLSSSECQFGLWFNAHTEHLAKIENIGRFVNRIEEHHNQLHKTYSDIYSIFFEKPQKRSLLHKIFTFNSKKVSESERERAKIHFIYLKRSSSELLEVLEVLEDKVKELENTELLKLFLDR
jgi:hypothetical protein